MNAKKTKRWNQSSLDWSFEQCSGARTAVRRAGWSETDSWGITSAQALAVPPFETLNASAASRIGQLQISRIGQLRLMVGYLWRGESLGGGEDRAEFIRRLETLVEQRPVLSVTHQPYMYPVEVKFGLKPKEDFTGAAIEVMRFVFSALGVADQDEKLLGNFKLSNRSFCFAGGQWVLYENMVRRKHNLREVVCLV